LVQAFYFFKNIPIFATRLNAKAQVFGSSKGQNKEILSK